MFASRSWVSGRSFCVPCLNIAIAAPTLCSTNITKTLPSLPKKTAQPPLVAARPRICTSITGLLILQVPSLAFPQRSELLSTGDQKPKPFRFVPLPVKNSILSSFRPPFKGTRIFGDRTYTLERSHRRLAQSVVGNPG